MSSHTPGPWHLETVKTQVGSCHKIGPFPSGSGFVGKQNHACVYSDGNGVGDKSPVAIELAANARLIAAAPTMYDFINSKALEGDEHAKRIIDNINAGFSRQAE